MTSDTDARLAKYSDREVLQRASMLIASGERNCRAGIHREAAAAFEMAASEFRSIGMFETAARYVGRAEGERVWADVRGEVTQ